MSNDGAVLSITPVSWICGVAVKVLSLPTVRRPKDCTSDVEWILYASHLSARRHWLSFHAHTCE